MNEKLEYEKSLKQYLDTKKFYQDTEDAAAEIGVHNEKIAIVKAGLSEGFPLEQIAKITRLTTDELKKFIRENKLL